LFGGLAKVNTIASAQETFIISGPVQVRIVDIVVREDHLSDLTESMQSSSMVEMQSPPQLRKSHARTIGIASIIWAASIFLSRIMGLVREQIIGRTLGASREADLYFASFTLPDFLNYLLAAGALSIVFIPIFVEYLERDDRGGGWRALSVIANFILLAGGVGIASLIVFARPLTGLVAPGFTGPGEVDTLVRLIRIILPAQIFLVIGGLLSAALQAQDRHFLPAMAPLVYSAGIIGGGLVGAQFPGMGAEGFAWGVLGGAALGPFALPLYGCIKTRMRWYPILSLQNEDLRRYLLLSFPIMIGFSSDGIEMIAPHRSNRSKPPTQDRRRLSRYMRRWLVERFFAWIQWQRRILVRWEYHAHNFLGFVQLACLVVLFRRF
jgi:O-antigen/teichoic acid export membrane protein